MVGPLPDLAVDEFGPLLDDDVQDAGKQDPGLATEASGHDLADAAQGIFVMQSTLNDGLDFRRGLAVGVQVVGNPGNC